MAWLSEVYVVVTEPEAWVAASDALQRLADVLDDPNLSAPRVGDVLVPALQKVVAIADAATAKLTEVHGG